MRRAVDAGDEDEEDRAYAFRVPTGKPAELACEEARRVIAQVRTGLAYEPDGVSPHALAAGAADWLDPHGLWSAAPDSPIEARIEKRAGELVAEMESRVGDDCPAARDVGDALLAWVDELRGHFDRARAARGDARRGGGGDEIPFDAIAYSQPAKAFADELGARRRVRARVRREREAVRRGGARSLLSAADRRRVGARSPRGRGPSLRPARRSARGVGAARRGGERLRSGSGGAPAVALVGEVGAHGDRRGARRRRVGAARRRAIWCCRSRG